MSSLSIGQKAPYFEGVDQNGKTIKLSDFAGKKLILYFYPKDNTPGCTAEACNLNDNLKELTKLGYYVVGVSPDSISSHQKFISKFNLGFTLISDTEANILKVYEAWGTKKMYGKTYEGVLRKTYVIDETGTIIAIIDKVDTKNHTKQILATLK